MAAVFPYYRVPSLGSAEDPAGPVGPPEIGGLPIGEVRPRRKAASQWPTDSRPSVVFIHYRDAVAFESVRRSKGSESAARAELEKVAKEVDRELDRLWRNLRRTTPFGEAMDLGRLGVYGQLAWVRLREDQGPVPYTGADALRALRHGQLEGAGQTLIAGGNELPMLGRRLVTWYQKDPPEDSDSDEPVWESTEYSLPRENVLVVAIRPDVLRDDAVLFTDGKQAGPWPYFLETGASTSPWQVAVATARCLGKLLGLGEESTDPGELSATDTWLRPLPNVWATTSPTTEVAPWSHYWGEEDEATRATAGHGISGVVARGETALQLMVPDEPCLLKKPLGSAVRRKSAPDEFCRVCRAHLEGVFGGAPKPLPIPVWTWKDGGFGPADVSPWAAEEEEGHDQRLWDAVKVKQVGSTSDPVARPVAWSPEPGRTRGEPSPPEEATWTLKMVAEGKADPADVEPTMECSLQAQSILSPGGRTVLLTFEVVAPSEGEQVVKWGFVNPIWATKSGPEDAPEFESFPVAAAVEDLDSVAKMSVTIEPGRTVGVPPGDVDLAKKLLLDGGLERLHTGGKTDVGLRGLVATAPSTEPGATTSTGLLYGHRALWFPGSGWYGARPEGRSASLGALLQRVLLQVDRNSLHTADDGGLLESERHLLFGYLNGLGTPGLPGIPSDLAIQPDPTTDGSVQVTLRDGQSKARFHAVWSYPGWDYATERLAEVIGREKGTYQSDARRPSSERSLFDPPLFTHMPGCGYPPQGLADDPPEEEPVG